MKPSIFLVLLLPLVLACKKSTAKPDERPPTEKQKELIYKKVGDVELKMTINYPGDYKKGDLLPAIILYYGGGWNSASPNQMVPQAKYFAEQGMIGITADYRVKNLHGTTPFEAVEDAKSSISYLREHASELGINVNKLAAGGGSAGGHIAAAADLTGSSTAQSSTFSCRPNALVLFNPVFNNGPGNYGYDRIGNRYPEISPYHNIKKGAAPTIVFLGTKDELIPVSVAQDYKIAMENLGSRCELYLFEGQTHGFFNREPFLHETMEKAATFLRSLGYLPQKINKQ